MMPGRLVRLLALALCFWATGLNAQTLPLPDNLTDLGSEQGEKYFSESGAPHSYFAVADNFVTQKTQAYCGVASIVMVLNALHTPAPTTPEYQPYHTFTQDNVLDEHTDSILPREILARQGMTLDQLGALLGLYPRPSKCITPKTAALMRSATAHAIISPPRITSCSSIICEKRSGSSSAAISRHSRPTMPSRIVF